ncbi:addiction module antidote protein, HigA family [delta proteobacterium NaphS2]|nr:addiction module antidote protein, HigA family [delta proteobacterium NaphS2]
MVVQTDLAIPPGEYLEEVLEELGITKDELARRMGRPAPKLSPIFKGRKAITPDTALQLEKVVGVPAHVWTGLEAEYRLLLARQQQIKERDQLKEETALIKPFCYAVLANMGAVPKLTKGPDKVLALQKFFGVTSLKTVITLRRYKAAFRCGAGKKERSPEAVSAWLRLGELKARKIDCAPFDQHRLKAAIPEIRALTLQPPDTFLPRLNDLLSAAGIALVILPHFPKTYAHGATFPAGREKTVLMLSIRGKWADIFWFSLFHELGHILLHDRNKIIVEYDNGNPELEKLEREADEFASGILIPKDKWSKFIARESFHTKDIPMFSRDVGVDAGIVVGRLQHEGFLKPSWGNDLRIRYQMALD